VLGSLVYARNYPPTLASPFMPTTKSTHWQALRAKIRLLHRVSNCPNNGIFNIVINKPTIITGGETVGDCLAIVAGLGGCSQPDESYKQRGYPLREPTTMSLVGFL
jgi:hypothetical protein